MKKVFIGHRGVGKSELLKRHQIYFPEIPHFDLDHEIASKNNLSVAEYFEEVGEAEFRQTEKAVFSALIQANSSFVISLGAGFDLSVLPADLEIVFVSRVTDQDGRIFLNRPRLEKELSPLDEYKMRYATRQEKYLARATEIYDLPEGVEETNHIEEKILTRKYQVTDAYYTLSSSDLGHLDKILKQYKKIELRTDLIDQKTIEDLTATYPQHDWLVSIRSSEALSVPEWVQVDADFVYRQQQHHILSSHADDIQQGIQQLTNSNAHLKLCPLVESFEQLLMGYRWQQQDPTQRSFLPRSSSSRWLWYRQLSKYLQKINFVRNFTRIADQPSLSDWLALPEQRPRHWAAVLGDPIYFSRSPQMHQNYFQQRKSFFTRIALSKEELKTHLDFLHQLGLTYAAVTSPLKETAYELNQTECQFNSVNTLYIKDSKIKATNTDVVGFEFLTRHMGVHDKVAIWGGGGTLEMMKSVLPQAHLFSSQTAKLRHKVQSEFIAGYDYLIWSAPRRPETQFPRDDLFIGQIIDLNYTENSMGLELAANKKIAYTSGLEMFRQQALKQQEFWSQHERE